MTTDAPHVEHGHAHPHGGGGALSRKIGPLPLGLWLLAIGGGLGIAVYMRRRASSAPVVTTDSTADLGSLDNTQPGAGNLAPVGDTGLPTDASGQLTATPTDNDSWWQLAVRRLSSTGYDAYAVQTALTDYLDGMTLTLTERAIVGEALVLVGPPPVAPPSPIPGGTTADPAIPTASSPSYPQPTPAPNTSPVPTGPIHVPGLGPAIPTPTDATSWPTSGPSVYTQDASGAWHPVTATAQNTRDNGNGVQITQTHVLATGQQTLAQIAKDNGMTVAQLQAANPGIGSGKVKPGTRITL